MMTKIVNLLQRYYGVVIATIVGIVLGMTLEQGTCKAIVEWLLKAIISLYPGDASTSDVLNNTTTPAMAVVSLGYLCTRRTKRSTYTLKQRRDDFVKAMQRAYLTFVTRALLDRSSLRMERSRKLISRNWSWIRNEIERTIKYLEVLGFSRDSIAIICQLRHEEWLEVQAYAKNLLSGYGLPLAPSVPDWRKIASEAEKLQGRNFSVMPS